MHTYIHTYLPTYLPTCIHTYFLGSRATCQTLCCVRCEPQLKNRMYQRMPIRKKSPLNSTMLESQRSVRAKRARNVTIPIG